MFFKKVKYLIGECGLIYLFCHYFTYINPWRIPLLNLPVIIAVLLVVNVVFYVLKKKKLRCIQQGKYRNIATKITLAVVSLLFIITSAQYVILLSNERGKVPQIISFLPSTQTPFPVSLIRKKQYVRDIKTHKQKPLEYVMQLFEKHDIVVLCERWHPEYTQWQLFSEMIFNDSFASKIGNVATEFGRINAQKHLDSLLNSSFKSEDDRKKAFSCLVRENGGMWSLWDNINVYDFAVNLSKFNENQHEKQKINCFFAMLQEIGII
jgi:hypothetical protein